MVVKLSSGVVETSRRQEESGQEGREVFGQELPERGAKFVPFELD